MTSRDAGGQVLVVIGTAVFVRYYISARCLFSFPLVIAIVVVAVAVTSSRVVAMCLCVRLCGQLSTVYRS